MTGGQDPATVGETGEVGRAAPFHISLAERGKRLLARIEGPLDVETCPELLRTIQGACEQSGSIVVVDLRDADYLDSAGVRGLMSLRNRSEGSHSELRLIIRPHSRVERTVSLLKLQGYFQIFASAAEAWEHAELPA